MAESKPEQILSNPKKWQVFFLPKQDALTTESTIVAFCPYTGIRTEGKDFQEAKQNWISEAEKTYKGKEFLIKKVRRGKVWQGTNERLRIQEQKEAPVYVLPIKKRPDDLVAVCPETNEILEGNLEKWKEIDSIEQPTAFLPSLWSDQVVECSDLNDFNSKDEKEASKAVIEPPKKQPTAQCHICTDDFTVSSPFRENLKFDSWKSNKLDCGLMRNSFKCHKNRKEDLNWNYGAQKILNCENAGGNSEYSEAASYQMIEAITGWNLYKTEMEIEYYPHGGSITDYLVRTDEDEYLGISVTRAMKFRGTFTQADAIQLLKKKMSGINSCSANIIAGNGGISRQILHILADEDYIADIVEKTYKETKICQDLKSSTLLMLTTINNAKWIFTNR